MYLFEVVMARIQNRSRRISVYYTVKEERKKMTEKQLKK